MGETEAGPAPSPRAPSAGRKRRSIWPAIHPRLLELVRAHRSTILFVNSRRLAERIAAALNELAGEDVARAHHGSIAREQRLLIEDALKAGRLPALVATSSLELGIDMGAVDLVVQIETPPSVASRHAAHRPGEPHRGGRLPRRSSSPSTAATCSPPPPSPRAMTEGRGGRDPRSPEPPGRAGPAARGPVRHRTAGGGRRSSPWSAAPRPSPRCRGRSSRASSTCSRGATPPTSSRSCGRGSPGTGCGGRCARARARCAWRSRTPGTIPDKGLYGVFLAEVDGRTAGTGAGRPPRGRARRGDGVREPRGRGVRARAPRAGGSSRSPATACWWSRRPGSRAGCPSGRPTGGRGRWSWAARIGELTRQLAAMPEDGGEARLVERPRPRYPGRAEPGRLPARPAAGDRRRCPTTARSCSSARATRWATGGCACSRPGAGACTRPGPWPSKRACKRRGETEVETIWSDDGLVLRLPDRERPPEAADLLPEPDEIEDLVMGELGGTALFAAHFREAAGARPAAARGAGPASARRCGCSASARPTCWRVAVALSLVPHRPRGLPRVPEGRLRPARLSSTWRARCRRREIRLVTVDTHGPVALLGVAALRLRRQLPLRRRRAPGRAPGAGAVRGPGASSASCMGEAELRELLDASALAELEESLLGLAAAPAPAQPGSAPRPAAAPGRPVAGGDRRPARGHRRGRGRAREAWRSLDLGPSRGAPRRPRRASPARSGSPRRRTRAASATPSASSRPPGCPRLSSSRSRTRCASSWPATRAPTALSRAEDVARRLGCGTAPVETALRGARAATGASSRASSGPEARGASGSSPDVLASLRQRSLAKLRREVAPAEPAALARTLLDWQGVVAARIVRGAGARRSARRGRAAPGRGLPRLGARARHPARAPARLPALGPRCAAAPRARWCGWAMAPLGDRDGRLSLYLADDLALLHEPARTGRKGELHERLRGHLRGHGASFFAELHGRRGRRPRAAGARGAVGPRLGRRGHERHSGRAARVPAPAVVRASRTPGAAPRRTSARGATSPPSAAGRWSLLARRAPGAAPAPPTERLLARAEQLLARHGVLTRAAVAAEDVPGGLRDAVPGAARPRGGGAHPPRLLRARARRLAVRPSGRARAAARAARAGAGRRRRCGGGGVVAGRDRSRQPLWRRPALAAGGGRRVPCARPAPTSSLVDGALAACTRHAARRSSRSFLPRGGAAALARAAGAWPALWPAGPRARGARAWAGPPRTPSRSPKPARPIPARGRLRAARARGSAMPGRRPEPDPAEREERGTRASPRAPAPSPGRRRPRARPRSRAAWRPRRAPRPRTARGPRPGRCPERVEHAAEERARGHRLHRLHRASARRPCPGAVSTSERSTKSGLVDPRPREGPGCPGGRSTESAPASCAPTEASSVAPMPARLHGDGGLAAQHCGVRRCRGSSRGPSDARGRPRCGRGRRPGPAPCPPRPSSRRRSPASTSTAAATRCRRRSACRSRWVAWSITSRVMAKAMRSVCGAVRLAGIHAVQVLAVGVAVDAPLVEGGRVRHVHQDHGAAHALGIEARQHAGQGHDRGVLVAVGARRPGRAPGPAWRRSRRSPGCSRARIRAGGHRDAPEAVSPGRALAVPTVSVAWARGGRDAARRPGTACPGWRRRFSPSSMSLSLRPAPGSRPRSCPPRRPPAARGRPA